MGIKAFPALISSARDIDADVPSPGQFDHVITVVPQGPGLVWLDTTTEVGPFAYLVPPLRDSGRIGAAAAADFHICRARAAEWSKPEGKTIS